MKPITILYEGSSSTAFIVDASGSTFYNTGGEAVIFYKEAIGGIGQIDFDGYEDYQVSEVPIDGWIGGSDYSGDTIYWQGGTTVALTWSDEPQESPWKSEITGIESIRDMQIKDCKIINCEIIDSEIIGSTVSGNTVYVYREREEVMGFWTLVLLIAIVSIITSKWILPKINWRTGVKLVWWGLVAVKRLIIKPAGSEWTDIKAEWRDEKLRHKAEQP